MFENFEADDRILHSEWFIEEEIQYNLLHRIIEYSEAIKIKTPENHLVLAQSKGHNPWLWISQKVDQEKRYELVQHLAKRVKNHDFPGISAEPDTARRFAAEYCKDKGKLYHTYMMLEAYYCPKVLVPVQVEGRQQQADKEHIPVIAAFMAGFMEDAFGAPEHPEKFISYAEEAVRSENLYLWMLNGEPVSMAAISHRSARHGRINDVYTPPARRKCGYASALVAGVCAELHREGITPVLYADAKNPVSNKVYKSIGFIGAGQIADIKFN